MNTRRRGRPRDPQIDRLILAATREHVGLVGVRRASIAAIVDRAGVGKPSLYLRWTNRGDLIRAATTDLCQNLRPASGLGLEQRLSDALIDDHAFLVTGAEAPFVRAVYFGGGDEPDLALIVERQILGPRRQRLADTLTSPGSPCPAAVATRAAGALLDSVLGEMVSARPTPTSTIGARIAVILYGARAARATDRPTPPLSS